MDKPWHLYLMAIIYILAGLNHFRKPKFYEKIIPPFIPYKNYVNEFIGFVEIIFGVYLFIPAFSNMAAWSIIGLLIIIFPANIYMAINKKASLGIPIWILLTRLPLQFLLIYWAYQYT
jgi:uncharacterized membrane protein